MIAVNSRTDFPSPEGLGIVSPNVTEEANGMSNGLKAILIATGLAAIAAVLINNENNKDKPLNGLVDSLE